MYRLDVTVDGDEFMHQRVPTMERASTRSDRMTNVTVSPPAADDRAAVPRLDRRSARSLHSRHTRLFL